MNTDRITGRAARFILAGIMPMDELETVLICGPGGHDTIGVVESVDVAADTILVDGRLYDRFTGTMVGDGEYRGVRRPRKTRYGVVTGPGGEHIGTIVTADVNFKNDTRRHEGD